MCARTNAGAAGRCDTTTRLRIRYIHQRIDPNKVRLCPKLSGTDSVVDDDGFDRRESQENVLLTGVVGDGVGVVLLARRCTCGNRLDGGRQAGDFMPCA